jgi:hypothetical protein
MQKPVPLRLDYDAAQLCRIARASENANQVRRPLALAAICDGASRTEAAEMGGVTLQVVRDWVLRFNAEGPEGLIDLAALLWVWVAIRREDGLLHGHTLVGTNTDLS